ncbi:MAG: caspase family protein [Bacteroidetes Order II. Incertae sedis bacterium]|nr:caspase family protein [Bacteroidetes Order II. bacterium]
MRFIFLCCFLWLGLVPSAFSQDEDPEEFRGMLQTGDKKLKSGEFYDEHVIEAARGQILVFDLFSREFDPYLIVLPEGGQQQDNDDHDGSNSKSQIIFSAQKSGKITVRITSSRPNQKGRYLLTVTNRSAALAGATNRSLTGALATTDTKLTTGEFFDTYEVEGIPGQSLKVTLVSTDFDPYLIIKTPSGKQHENDDAGEDKDRAALDLNLTENGTYKIYVTAYGKGETGAYSVKIGTTNEGTGAAQQEQRDVIVMAIGQSKQGKLEHGDATSEDGAFCDYYAFEGRKGENVVIELATTAFDPFLELILPDGSDITNDDWEGSNRKSRIELTLPGTGRYRITATAYSKKDVGTYSMKLLRGATPPVGREEPRRPNPQPRLNPQPGRPTSGPSIYGLFVGISDYNGRQSPLRYTAQDARTAKDALVRGANMPQTNGVVLTDAQATVANFKAELRRLASKVGPQDMFVLFYSGHGGRYARQNWQSSDPDQRDESIELYDAEILDDEMNLLLDQVKAKTTLLILDSCFSGGFSKDVISKPGRMGLFSSEEDVTSGVAFKFQAGGYLAKFFADALLQTNADEDGDGNVSSFELSQYLYERYRGDVKSSGPDDDDIVLSSRSMGYQKLVVDRGSIRPNDVLFKKR